MWVELHLILQIKQSIAKNDGTLEMEGVRFVERKNAEGEVEKIVIGRTGDKITDKSRNVVMNANVPYGSKLLVEDKVTKKVTSFVNGPL